MFVATQALVWIQRFYLKVSACGAGKCKMEIFYIFVSDRLPPTPAEAKKELSTFYLKVSACGVGKCKMQMLHASATDKPVPVAETELVLHHRQRCDVEL